MDQSRLVPDTTADPATLTLPVGMELDFGSLAKGYAGESCARLLKEAGVSSALLNLGGNIQTIGAKPDGSAWRVGIQDPKGSEEDYVGIVELVDQTAITSGGYQRYFEQDGVRYWHILDPRTGSPARSGLSSVTVIGSSGTRCDGLSTALRTGWGEGLLPHLRRCGAGAGHGGGAGLDHPRPGGELHPDGDELYPAHHGGKR